MAGNNAPLWATLNSVTNTGEFWGYSLASSTFLSVIYDPAIQTANATAHCSGLLPTLPASFTPSSFAEPTLVNGMIFAPVYLANNASNVVIGGGGILVYGTCK